MAFDLSSAVPVDTGKFDIASAVPVEAPPATAGQDRGASNAFAGGIVDVIPGAKKLAAGIDAAALYPFKKGTYSDLYKQQLADEEATSKAHPIASGAGLAAGVASASPIFKGIGTAAGALVDAIPGGKAVTGALSSLGTPAADAGYVSKAANLGIRSAKGAAGAAPVGALYGAANDTTGHPLEGAESGAEAAGVLGAGLPVAAAGLGVAADALGPATRAVAGKVAPGYAAQVEQDVALGKIIKRINADFPDPVERQAALEKAINAPGVGIGEALGGKKTTDLAMGAAQYPSGKAAAADYIDTRTSGAPARIAKTFADQVSSNSDYFGTVEGITEKGRKAAGPLYKTAFDANKAVSSPEIDKVLATPSGQLALKAARTNMLNDQSDMGLPAKDVGNNARDAAKMGFMTADNANAPYTPTPVLKPLNAAQKAYKNPILKWIADNGGVVKGSDLDSHLKNMGFGPGEKLTPVGLFKNDINGGKVSGRASIDNVPVNEFNDQFDTHYAGDEHGYMKSEDIIDSIRKEQDHALSPQEQHEDLQQRENDLKNEIYHYGIKNGAKGLTNSVIDNMAWEHHMGNDYEDQFSDYLENQAMRPEQEALDAGAPPSRLNLRSLDYVKKALDRQYSSAVKGMDNETSSLDPQAILRNKQQLVAEMDRLDETGAYARARQVSGDYLRNSKAMDDGREFMKPGTAGQPEQIAAKFKALGPTEQEAYKAGMVRAVKEAMDKPSADQPNYYTKVFGSADMQNRLKAVLNPSEFEVLSKNMQAEQDLYKFKYDVLGNSRTAEKQIASQEFENGGKEIYQDLINNGSPTKTAIKAVTKWVGSMFDGMSNKTAGQVSKILYETDPAKKLEILKSIQKDAQLDPAEKQTAVKAYYSINSLFKNLSKTQAGVNNGEENGQ